ncbi:Vacuole membrane protein 1 [Nymphon striatum]|nr:Vacuole membrane protein 1 [Nymphon striatum]
MKGKQRSRSGSSSSNNQSVGDDQGPYFKNMSKDELRDRLKHKGLKITGRRNEMVKRLEQAEKQKMSSSVSTDHVFSSSQLNVKRRSTGHAVESVRHNGNSKFSTLQADQKMIERKERESIVLWKQPLTTLYYFYLELLADISNYGKKLFKQKFVVMLMMILLTIAVGVYNSHGSQYKFIQDLERLIFICAYWLGLGILSSVGLGTGLHTFLLYLGPHIATVTMAAYECGSLDFPEPPYPDSISCPKSNSNVENVAAISIWSIMTKVRLEAFMWGTGTALGELPPYFVAKRARLSGNDPDDEELEEFEELLQHEKDSNKSVIDRAKLTVEKLVEKAGFLGILACASIPNPLFDLAGITCGHFLVPFWTFFGATLIGKAVVKMHIQKLFVIIAFNEHHFQKVVDLLKYIPYIGIQLQAPFKEMLLKQKASLHHDPRTGVQGNPTWLSWIFEKFVILMIVYFVLSIINSMAQSYHKRMCKELRNQQTLSKDNKLH